MQYRRNLAQDSVILYKIDKRDYDVVAVIVKVLRDNDR